MKKNQIIVGVLIVALIVGIVGWYLWPVGTVRLQQVDELGTEIVPSKKVSGRIGTSLNSKEIHLSGYTALRGMRIKFKCSGSTAKIVYRSAMTTEELNHELKNSKYLAATFQVMNSGLSEKQQNYNHLKNETDRLRLMLSNDGIHWKKLAVNYPNIAVRDPDIQKISGRWWIVYTTGLMWSKDLKKWHFVNVDFNPTQVFTNVWAPTFYRAANGKWYIVSANSTDESNYRLFRYDFDVNTGEVSNPEQISTGTQQNHTNLIDPRISYKDGKYRLIAKDEANHVLVTATSTNDRSFKNLDVIKLNLSTGWIPEGPTSINVGNQSKLLYFDLYDTNQTFTGVHVVKFRNNHYASKVERLQADFLVRHLSIYRLGR